MLSELSQKEKDKYCMISLIKILKNLKNFLKIHTYGRRD